MKQRLSLLAVGYASSTLLATTYLLCVGFDLLFPELAMNQAWLALLPGFVWITWPHFLLGLVESYGYGWYITLIWVPVYNFAVSRSEKRSTALQEITKQV